MTSRVRIERLVVDEGVLAPRDVPRFEAAVARELSRLREGRHAQTPPEPVSWHTLARDTAAAIHDRMPKR